MENDTFAVRLNAQKAGFLYKKPFGHNSSKWSRRYASNPMLNPMLNPKEASVNRREEEERRGDRGRKAWRAFL